jgi:hypothetical protein
MSSNAAFAHHCAPSSLADVSVRRRTTGGRRPCDVCGGPARVWVSGNAAWRGANRSVRLLFDLCTGCVKARGFVWPSQDATASTGGAR